MPYRMKTLQPVETLASSANPTFRPFVLCPLSFVRGLQTPSDMPKPARARASRGLMADDDEPPAASSSALHSAVEESAGASVPPLPRLQATFRQPLQKFLRLLSRSTPTIFLTERRLCATRRRPSSSSCSSATSPRIRRCN